MIVTNNNNNLVFDDQSSDCRLIVSRTGGRNYAFVQCLDASAEEHAKGKNRGTRRYWGEFHYDDKENSIRQIMNSGGKWPDLPTENVSE